MEISGTNFNALATDGDVRLGGQDWDQRIVDFVAEEFIRQHKIDPREDPNAAGRLWRECEDAKRTLSLRSKAAISYDFKGAAVRLEITREKFEEITHDLLDRTRFTTRQTLQAAGLTWEQDRPRPPRRRLDPNADGPRDAQGNLRQRPRCLGLGRRGGRPRRGAARRDSRRPHARQSDAV